MAKSKYSRMEEDIIALKSVVAEQQDELETLRIQVEGLAVRLEAVGIELSQDFDG